MRTLFTLLTSALCAMQLLAQTNPQPFNLGAGNYVLNNWPASAPAANYPASMMFHVYDTENNSPDVDSQIVGDWLCAYNIETRSRINGEGSNGFSFINTGNTQDDQIRCGGGPDDVGGYVGAATIALNTIDRGLITVNYLATKLTAGSGEPLPREYMLRLEYRAGTGGDFTAVEGSALSSDDIDVDAPQTMGFVLPEEANNHPNMQLRWRYYQEAANDGGQRPQWRVGSISVSSTFVSDANFASANGNLLAFPNPSSDGRFVLSENVNATLFDITGKMLEQINNSNELNLSGLNAGIYLLKTENGAVLKLLKQ